MDPDRLGDLVADALHRVEGVQRALEDDGGLRPAHRAKLAPVHCEDIGAVDKHGAANLGRWW